MRRPKPLVTPVINHVRWVMFFLLIGDLFLLTDSCLPDKLSSARIEP